MENPSVSYYILVCYYLNVTFAIYYCQSYPRIKWSVPFELNKLIIPKENLSLSSAKKPPVRRLKMQIFLIGTGTVYLV